jgi:hypothetical protein
MSEVDRKNQGDDESTQQERALDARARRAARSAGLMACKSRQDYSWDNQGGFMLVDPYTNSVVEGVRFELTAQHVIEHCK